MGCVWRFGKILKMPTDGLALAVTTGLGFSVFAGIISGVCYVLTYGLPKRRHKKAKTPWHCTICGSQFRSIDGILEVDKVVTCSKCKRKACKQKCSKKLQQDSSWICLQCQPESWFFGLINSLQPNTNTKGWYSVKKMDQTTIDEIDEDILELQKREREQVRDFIERLLGALLGGDLDNVSVKRLYNDPKYLPISGQSPCTAHATLKHLIQKFIEEAAGLPKLKKIDDDPALPDDTRDRTYEDLLSTAVINKVIQNYQAVGEPSSSGSLSSRASTSSRKRCDQEYFFGDKNLQNKSHEDTSSVSSLDEWVRDSAQGSTKYFDKKSLTIRKRLDEISSTEDEVKDEEDDERHSLNLAIRDNDWQENWHLRRRKPTGSLSPAPMLVPNPNSHAKVLIGDREAEDTSDLSDGASEFEEVLEPTSINAVLVNSRCLIGGRNPIESLLAKAESISDGGSTDDSDLAEEKDDIVQKFSSLESRDDIIAQVANESLISQHDIDYYDLDKEQDSEYTEKYATLPRTIVKYPQAAPRQSKMPDMKSSYLLVDSKMDNADSGVTSEEDERQKSVNGDYKVNRDSKSGYQSEENSNNFTSPFERGSSILDSLSKLEKKQSEEISFEKLRCEISRVEEKTEVATESSKRPETLTGTLNESPISQLEESPFGQEVFIESPIRPDAQVVFRALPVIVKEDFSDIESSLEPTTPTFSSEAESIERTYNLETGKIINSRKSETGTLKGLSFTQKNFDENENVLPTSTPIANHMRLVTEIANESPEIYSEVALLSPPGDFKSLDCSGLATKIDFKEDFSLTHSNEDFSSLEENLHPVRSVLKKLSQSFPELTRKPASAFPKQRIIFDDSENEVEIQDGGTVTSIKEKFEAVSNGKQEVYSLTARSIPKQFRQELKKEIVKDLEEIPANKSPSDQYVVPFPKAKSKIEFFENFSKQF